MFYTKTTKKCLEDLNTSEKGLSKSEAEERILEYGKNIITVKGEPFWKKIIEPFKSVFMLVLFVAAVVSFLHKDYADAIIIFSIILINATIYYAQIFSTDRVLKSLKEHDKNKVSVFREKEIISLDAIELVPGDVIVLEEGEKIPADARLLNTESFRVDESQLTGESFPIEKQIKPIDIDKEIYEQTNMIFQGSFVVGGSATALVVATGNDTEFGKLATLSVNQAETSPVQKKIDNLISIIIRSVAAIAFVALLLSIYRGMSLSEGIKYVLALSVSAVPESLPVAITVVLVLGMRRMAKKKSLIKTTDAIETVGSLTVIATDKTGTLTKNKLTLQRIWSYNKNENDLINVVQKATNHTESKVSDPLDIALLEYLNAQQVKESGAKLISKLPFDQDFAMSGNLFQTNNQSQLFIKGSPESILSRSNLTEKQHASVMSELHSMAGKGLRVIAFAHVNNVDKINSFKELAKHNLEFDGLVAVADVLRPEAKESIKIAQKAGIKVCMITGDHFETSFHIGKELGLVKHRDQVFDCKKIKDLSDNELSEVIDNINVFSRVTPENKYRILTVLKQKNIVAMTGDGVNDVPALTNAHVGIAMGSGASIAKDAGDMILLDSNFKSIVEAVHEGRTTYSNIKRMVAYLLSTNAGEVLVAIGSLIIGIPVPLLPVQILWVNLVTDTCLVIPLGLEPRRKRNMNQPPQKPNGPLFSNFMISRIILVAVIMSIVTLTLYIDSMQHNSQDYARTVAFQTLIVMQWASAFCYRSDYESFFGNLKRFSLAFYIGLFIAIVMQLLAMSDLLRPLLHLVPISTSDMLVSSFVAITVTVVIVEVHKFIGRRYFKKGAK